VIVSYLLDAVIMPSIDKERMDNAMQAIMDQHHQSILENGDQVLKQRTWKPEGDNVCHDRVSTATLLKDLVVMPAAVLTGATILLYLAARARRSSSVTVIWSKCQQLKNKIKREIKE
jgi:hypothetical protein